MSEPRFPARLQAVIDLLSPHLSVQSLERADSVRITRAGGLQSVTLIDDGDRYAMRTRGDAVPAPISGAPQTAADRVNDAMRPITGGEGT